MPTDKAVARPDPIRNLQVVLGLVGLGLFGWWWATFSGPFRRLIDAQLRFFGSYSETAAAVVLAVAVALSVALMAVLLRRAWPRLSARAAETAIAVLFAVAGLAALAQAGQLWLHAARLPTLSDPLQVVDLDRVGAAAVPTGHVRLIGSPDRSRQALTYSAGRYGFGSDWTAWTPVLARQHRGVAAPAAIVASRRDADRSRAALGVADNPEGLLLAEGMDTRTMYEARLEGLDVARDVRVLYADDEVRFDTYVNAVLLAGMVVLVGCFVVYGWVRDRGARSAAPSAAAAPPANDAEPQHEPAPQPEPESWLSRVAVGAAVAAVLVAMLLWQVVGDVPDRVLFWGWGASALTLVIAVFLSRLDQRDEAITPAAKGPLLSTTTITELQPPPGAALLCVLRDEPVSSASYKRVDVDGVRVAVLKANRYTVVALEPGPHTLAVNTRYSLTSDTVARFDAAAGEVVIYRMIVPTFGSLRLERCTDIDSTRADAIGLLR